mmetsp:Transcript_17897/g.54744  ORF Transcript_17897/g.54744 Transcript_17897/m.54744 type:complete len:284 (+) Transcript_17897:372-1223(+)
MPAGGVRAVERDGDGVAREPPKSGGRRGLELVADGDPRGRGDAERGVSKNDFPQVGHDQRRGRGRRDDSGRRLHRGESRGLRRRLHRAGVSPLGGRRHGPRAPLRPRPLLSVQPRLRVRAERQLLPQVATVLRPPPHLQRLHDPVRALPRSRRLRLHVRPRRPRRLQLRPRRPRRHRRRRRRRAPPRPHPRRPPRRRRQPPRRLPRTPLRPLLQARRPRLHLRLISNFVGRHMPSVAPGSSWPGVVSQGRRLCRRRPHDPPRGEQPSSPRRLVSVSLSSCFLN